VSGCAAHIFLITIILWPSFRPKGGICHKASPVPWLSFRPKVCFSPGNQFHIVIALRSTANDLRSTTNALRSTTNALRSTTNALRSITNALRSTTNALRSTTNALRSTTNALRSTTNALRSTTNALRSTTNALRSIKINSLKNFQTYRGGSYFYSNFFSVQQLKKLYFYTMNPLT